MSALDYPYAALIDGATSLWLRWSLSVVTALVGALLGMGPADALPRGDALVLLLWLLPVGAAIHPIGIALTAIMAGAWLNLLAGSRFLPECVLVILLYYLIGAYIFIGSLSSSYSVFILCAVLGVILLLHLILRIQARRRLANMA